MTPETRAYIQGYAQGMAYALTFWGATSLVHSHKSLAPKFAPLYNLKEIRASGVRAPIISVLEHWYSKQESLSL